jgi:hypothetical protein
MRLVLVLAGLVFAYVVPTESLDVYFWATPGAVVVRGSTGPNCGGATRFIPWWPPTRRGGASRL